MKILVISDTHGVLGKIYEVYRKYDDIDMILHLGDHIDDAQDLAKRLNVDVYGVKGNCDGALTKDDCSRIIETEAGRILITHGHADGVNFGISNLYYRALEEGCVAAFYGHTHVPFLDETGEVVIMNPGSLTKPRDGSEGSYGIVEVSEEGVKCEIVYYKKPYKAEGGYIRGLINYSDRF